MKVPHVNIRQTPSIGQQTLREQEAFLEEERRGERKNRFGDPDQHKIRYKKRITLSKNPFDKKD